MPRAVTHERIGDRHRDLRRPHHADLDRIDAHVVEHRVDLSGHELRLDQARTALTPRVFCAVSAVTAAMP